MKREDAVVQVNRDCCNNAVLYYGPSLLKCAVGSMCVYICMCTFSTDISANSSSAGCLLQLSSCVRKGSTTHHPQLLIRRYVTLKVKAAELRVGIQNALAGQCKVLVC